MVSPTALILVGITTGIGGAVSYAAFNFAQQNLSDGGLKMRTEEERLQQHQRIYGQGSTPPVERMGRGQTVSDLLPMPPDQGPPLPRFIALRWPWKK
jgi:hypothetical protein